MKCVVKLSLKRVLLLMMLACMTLACGSHVLARAEIAAAEDGSGYTDTLNREFTGVSKGTTYVGWSGKTGSSGAVYAGNSAGGNDSIQLRSSSNSGIVTTTSGGVATKVSVAWNGNTASNRELKVYGKASAYDSASDLYDDTACGDYLGSIVYGSSTELEISDAYEYIGLRSSSGAMYLDSIVIDWNGGSDDPDAPSYEIAIPPCENGSVVVKIGDEEVGEAKAGKPVTIEAVQDDGFRLESLTVTDADGETVSVSNSIFVMPDCSVTITASFVP